MEIYGVYSNELLWKNPYLPSFLLISTRYSLSACEKSTIRCFVDHAAPDRISISVSVAEGRMTLALVCPVSS